MIKNLKETEKEVMKMIMIQSKLKKNEFLREQGKKLKEVQFQIPEQNLKTNESDSMSPKPKSYNIQLKN